MPTGHLDGRDNQIECDLNGESAPPHSRRARDAWLLHLLKSNLFGIGIGDFHGRCLDCNEYLAARMGYSRAEIQTGNVWWSEFTVPECREEVMRHVAEAKATGTCPAFESEVFHRDGSRIPLLIHLTAAPDDPECSLVLIVDLTQQKQTERELRLSESRFRMLVEGNKDCAYFMLDPQGIVANWSEVAQRLHGYQACDVVGKPLSVFYTADDVALGKPQRLLEEATGAGRAEVECWRLRKDGSRFWAQVVLMALRDDAGALAGFMNMTTDMTRWRRSEALLASTLNSVADAIVGIDKTGRIDSFNAAAEAIFGYRESEVLGRNVNMLMPEPYHSRHDQYLANYLTTGEAKLIGKGTTASGRRKDGSVFPVDLTVNRFELNDELHFTGVVRDITQQRKLEDQLRQAQKMEAVGQLAGGVAHDFNNLLTVILGYSELLLEATAGNDVLRSYAEAINSSGERAAGLTSQLLAFSRRSVITPKLLDLNFIVQDIEKMLRRLIGEHIELSTVLAPGLAPVNADPGQLGQVLINLAINARDAMQQGGQLVIETANTELDETYCAKRNDLRPGPYVALTFTDSGVGMSEEVKQHIFEPFFTTKDPGQGTGLGLATVYGIVQQNGGVIQVYSEPLLGTTFKILLPAVVPAASTSTTACPEEPSLCGRETILLVEDEEDVRAMAKSTLERYGYRVLASSNGEEALGIVGPDVLVDVLLTDVVMPRVGGRELAQAMQKRFPAMKFIFMSGYTNDAVIRRGIMDAEVAFVQKPFTPKLLAKKVREVLDQQSPPLTFPSLSGEQTPIVAR